MEDYAKMYAVLCGAIDDVIDGLEAVHQMCLPAVFVKMCDPGYFLTSIRVTHSSPGLSFSRVSGMAPR